MSGSEEHREKSDALTLQLSRASTLVERPSNTTAPHQFFEGREFYDPHAAWTPQEESRVKLKTDIRLLGWLSVMFFGMQLDATSMSNAQADNILHDLGFTMTEYGNGMMIFRICFLISGLPGQLIAMRYGHRYLFPGLMCAWGATHAHVLTSDFIAMAQAWMGNETGFYVTRALIGTCEGAFGPMAVMFLADFYTNTELAFRIAILASGVNIAKALTSLEAAGILKMRGVADRPGMSMRPLLASNATNMICVGWFWLFLINGLLIFLIGLMGMFYLPAGPTRTQGVFWRKPWFTNREQGKSHDKILPWFSSHVHVQARTAMLNLKQV
ncbi:putative MFS transporter [Aureobasidium subglaciale]|nr:putative MFS transporter [Aureobasidium subglaciale]